MFGEVDMPIPATEAERDEFADRDRVRKIAGAALDVFLSAALFTPAGTALDLDRLFDEMKGGVIPAVREYRARQAHRVDAVDPADLTCEDP